MTARPIRHVAAVLSFCAAALHCTGMPIAPRTAREYGIPQLDLSCKRGAGWACRMLGQKYVNGEGVPKDEQQGAAYYERGCFSDSGCCVALGMLRRDGRGVPKSDGEAVALFRTACSRGNAFGCSDRSRAAALLKISCDGGDRKACTELARVLKRRDAR